MPLPWRTRLRRYLRKPYGESAVLPLVILAVDGLLLLQAAFVWGFDRARLTLVHIAFFSAATFACFALDKWFARRRLRRVAERNLILLSFLGGSPGAIVALALVRHKTRELLFRVLIPVSLFVNAFFFGYLILG
jgi:uncharacterized membrane protein YsdA (DUF1294 family)